MSEPQIIVCANERQYRRAKEQTKSDPYTTVTDGLRVRDLAGRSFYRVIVCDGVDLNRDVEGEGPLGALLKRRQKTYTHPIWIEL